MSSNIDSRTYEGVAAYVFFPGMVLGSWIVSEGWRSGKIKKLSHYPESIMLQATYDVFMAFMLGVVIWGGLFTVFLMMAKDVKGDSDAE